MYIIMIKPASDSGMQRLAFDDDVDDHDGDVDDHDDDDEAC